jgi:hypothetical protein
MDWRHRFTDVSFDVELAQEQSRYTFVGISAYNQFRAFAVLDSSNSAWNCENSIMKASSWPAG